MTYRQREGGREGGRRKRWETVTYRQREEGREGGREGGRRKRWDTMTYRQREGGREGGREKKAVGDNDI